MKKNKFIYAILSLLLVMGVGCSRDNDIVIPQTKVNKLDAQTVNIGDSITLTGENIHLITRVLFGEVEAENINLNLGERNRNQLKVAVPTFPATQVFALKAIYNTVCEIVVCDEMEVYVPPVIPAVTSLLPAEVMSGNIISLEGSDLNIISRILINDSEVAIRSKDFALLTFIAPEVTRQTEATVKLVYDNSLGEGRELVVEGTLVIKPVPPVLPAIATAFPMEVNAGEQILLNGTDLQVVSGVKLNGEPVQIATKTETNLSFVAPTVTVETVFNLSIIYDNSLGDGQEMLFESAIKVKPVVVPSNVLVWKNVYLGGQATGLSFFDASAGVHITPCDLFDMQDRVDFMMNVSSGGENQFYSPANAANILKNQKCGDLLLGVADETGDNKSYASFLTTVSKFRLLVTSSAAQAAVIEKALAGNIEDLSDPSFEGITNPSSSAPKNPLVNNVFWFKNEKKAKNGLVVIREVINDSETPANNKLKVDIYYQK